MDLTAIQMLILDVDGVLTDGRLTLLPEGAISTAFHVHDGCAIKLWLRRGRQIAVLSSRVNENVHRRAAELGIECVYTGIKDKAAEYGRLLSEHGLSDHVTSYIGDDLPDLEVMRRCGFAVAVANANPAIKRESAYVTRRCGGRGAVAEVVELLLRKQGRWRLSPGEEF